MKFERLVIGSRNRAKVGEWSRFLEGAVTVVRISEIGEFPEPEETGDTFAQNARIKAAHYARLTREYVFSEDGGYEVDALGGLPGVKSRRILPGDKDGTDQELIDFVLDRLKGVPQERRTVKLSFVAVVCNPEGKIIFEDKDSLGGIVAQNQGPVLIPGYPFRTIHYLPELGKTYAELTPEEHDKYNHKKGVAENLARLLLDREKRESVMAVE